MTVIINLSRLQWFNCTTNNTVNFEVVKKNKDFLPAVMVESELLETGTITSSTYFTCTLGQAAEINARHPHVFKTVNDLLDYQAEHSPDLPAVAFPLPNMPNRSKSGPMWAHRVLSIILVGTQPCCHSTDTDQHSRLWREALDLMLIISRRTGWLKKLNFYPCLSLRSLYSAQVLQPSCLPG